MADLTCTINEAMLYLYARQIHAAAGRAFPFPAKYIMDKLDTKIPKELTSYEKARVEQCELYAAKDADGKPVLIDGKYDLSPEGLAAIEAVLAPLRDEVLTITNVRKIKPSEMGDVALTDPESKPLAPFLSDDDHGV